LLCRVRDEAAQFQRSKVVIDARYKSLFIFPAVGVTIILFGVSVFAALLGGNEATAWLGAAIASLPLPVIATYLMFGGVERTSENFPLMLLVAAAGVAVSAWEQFIEGSSGWAPTSVALAGALLLLMYVFWYSRFGRFDSVHLMVGSKLPEFTLKGADGEEFNSSSLLGAPAVIMFYRGNWCPLCMAQIKEIAERYHDMEALGIKVCLVSPQPEELTRKLAGEYDVPFEFLVDEGNKVAEELNIAIRNGVPVGLPGGYPPDTVLPTLIVTNEKGTILFSDQTDNYRVRPEPDIFLAILRRAGVVAK
jgi:peroxiredoxin